MFVKTEVKKMFGPVDDNQNHKDRNIQIPIFTIIH